MAFTETIEDETLKKDWRNDVRDQIANFIPGFREQFSIPGPENTVSNPTAQLGESFKIWEIDIKRLPREGSGESLENLLSDTGDWHHQVFINGKAQGYAESCMQYNGKTQVCSLAISPLAEKIDRAIDKIDAYPDQVRFIVVRPFHNVPSFSLFAFWLVESKKVHLLEAPAKFMRMLANAEDFLHETDFIALLSRYCRQKSKRT